MKTDFAQRLSDLNYDMTIHCLKRLGKHEFDAVLSTNGHGIQVQVVYSNPNGWRMFIDGEDSMTVDSRKLLEVVDALEDFNPGLF